VKVCPILDGDSVSLLVLKSGMPRKKLYRWHHQALIETALAEEIDSIGGASLRAARNRIKALERNLSLVYDAFDIDDSSAVMDPNGGRPSQ
jgi:hypothetical protein